MIESAIRLIDEVNSAVLMGNKDMLGYSHDALEQAISIPVWNERLPVLNGESRQP